MKPSEEQIRALEDLLADKNNPKWEELGRVMAEDIRKQMFLRYHTPVEELIKEGIRGENKMEPKFLKDYVRHFKEHLERNYPHKDIAEYTRLMDAIDTFIKYGVWSDLDE